MTKKPTAVQSEYEAAVEKLRKFCEDHTDLTPIIMDTEYPIRVQFFPNTQLSLFGDEFSDKNVDENGEVNDLTVVVGLSTSVRSTLKFKMDSKLLKKLIKLAEKIGILYYLAFRAEQGERLTPRRPIIKAEDVDGDGVLCCPCCEHTIGIRLKGVNRCDRGTPSNFCQDCGQALDWTLEHEMEPNVEEVTE